MASCRDGSTFWPGAPGGSSMVLENICKMFKTQNTELVKSSTMLEWSILAEWMRDNDFFFFNELINNDLLWVANTDGIIYSNLMLPVVELGGNSDRLYSQLTAVGSSSWVFA